MSKWRYSTDEEHWTYPEGFDTRERAIAEGHAVGLYPFWVGREEPPLQPEDAFDFDTWEEAVFGYEDYCYGFSDWDTGTLEQREELVAAVRAAMKEWLDRHGLRPHFFMIGDSEKFEGPEKEGGAA